MSVNAQEPNNEVVSGQILYAVMQAIEGENDLLSADNSWCYAAFTSRQSAHAFLAEYLAKNPDLDAQEDAEFTVIKLQVSC